MLRPPLDLPSPFPRALLAARVAPAEEELREPREVPEGVGGGDADEAVDVASSVGLGLGELEAEGEVRVGGGGRAGRRV